MVALEAAVGAVNVALLLVSFDVRIFSSVVVVAVVAVVGATRKANKKKTKHFQKLIFDSASF